MNQLPRGGAVDGSLRSLQALGCSVIPFTIGMVAGKLDTCPGWAGPGAAVVHAFLLETWGREMTDSPLGMGPLSVLFTAFIKAFLPQLLALRQTGQSPKMSLIPTSAKTTFPRRSGSWLHPT